MSFIRLCRQPAPRLIDQRRGLLDLAEMPAEGQLLVVGEPLAGEDQHRMAVHRRGDRRDRRGIQAAAQVEPIDPRSEAGAERGETKRRRRRCTIVRHRVPPLLAW